ncbi:MAG TPA: hypothetical protein VJ654_02835 [Noviherbaspirillum sp.]|nr:hypothetical protein [Noviherbaspirillum sp.]
MANNHTRLHAVNSDGQQVSFLHTNTDSPILPTADLIRLHELDPKLVNWIVEQTELEAEARRTENRRINLYVFIERISGVVAGAFVAVFGFLIGGYLVLQGHDWAGVGICGTTLVSIVSVLVTRDWSNRKSEKHSPQKPKRAKNKKP